MRIKDIKLLDDGVQQSVAVEFATGEVRTLSAQQLYDATRSMGHGTSDPKTAAQRRAEELLALRRGRR
ncbi:MAG: hypothetical protein QGG64_16320 [Candidatus Latescibacteria bacterium]|jgi:hypothetical protein|nr:hypothetical protein [Candidatus Latescibacterota bacterium]